MTSYCKVLNRLKCMFQDIKSYVSSITMLQNSKLTLGALPKMLFICIYHLVTLLIYGIKHTHRNNVIQKRFAPVCPGAWIECHPMHRGCQFLSW